MLTTEFIAFPSTINASTNLEVSQKKAKTDSRKIKALKVAKKVANAFGKLGEPIKTHEIYAKFEEFSKERIREQINKVINACESLRIESKLNPETINKYAELLGYQLTWSGKHIIMLHEIGPPSFHIEKDK